VCEKGGKTGVKQVKKDREKGGKKGRGKGVNGRGRELNPQKHNII
jgi:hypothetical protein